MANNPTLLSMELCKDADKNTIPATDAGTSGLFSEQYGWQNINSLPLSAGGIAPNRRDFNGAFNLLGGIAYYAQKGFTFNFDSTQEYFAGCVVIDTTDGKRYECIADVAAGGNVPSTDATYWKEFGDISTKANITLDNLAAYHRDVITTSGTYTAPATALYKVTIKGGGGGGSASGTSTPGNPRYVGGGGGGEGGTTIAYLSMTAGDTVNIVIGAGGAGGTGNIGVGVNGGSSSVAFSGNTYTATGGGGAGHSSGYDSWSGGIGGTGTINGCSGVQSARAAGDDQVGGTGGGAGGGICPTLGSAGLAGATNSGAGGAGGGGGSTSHAGGKGGDGFVQFEYFA